MTNCIIACISASITFIWLEKNKQKNQSNSKVLFYNPLLQSKCSCKSILDIQCTDVNCSSINTRHIINCLKNATKSIDICVFCLSHITFCNIICDAYSRGVLVRVIINNCLLDQSFAIKQLHSLGIPMKYQNKDMTCMHNKFCIVDSTWLINGSMNWTYQATINNWENVLITNKPSITNEFIKNFEQIWLTIEL